MSDEQLARMEELMEQIRELKAAVDEMPNEIQYLELRQAQAEFDTLAQQVEVEQL